MSKWLHKFMEKPDISDNTDISDKPDKWDRNLENMPGGGPDKPDRLDPSLNLSGLSGPPWGLLEENLEINPRKGSDKSDRFKLRANRSPNDGGLLSVLSVPLKGLFAETSFYPLDGTSLHDDYEERLAIAEYDGHQNSIQAQCIAYLDAFVSVLITLPYEDAEGDWLAYRIRAAQNWLLDQDLSQPS